MDFDFFLNFAMIMNTESLFNGTYANFFIWSQTKKLNSLVSHNPEVQLCGTGSFHPEEMLVYNSHSFSNVFLF